MKKTKITRVPALTAVGMAGVLTLTACSSSTGFDFTQYPEDVTSGFEFSVPRDLAELNEFYTENRFYDSITLTAVESEDPSMCAVKYSYDFAKDGLERLIEIAETSDDVRDDEKTLEDTMTRYLTHVNASSERVVLEDDYSSAVVSVDCAVSPHDEESTLRVSLGYFHPEDESRKNIANADVSVMRGSGKDGELYIQEFSTPNWRLDSNGNWIVDNS
jgi:hypothetical protein